MRGAAPVPTTRAREPTLHAYVRDRCSLATLHSRTRAPLTDTTGDMWASPGRGVVGECDVPPPPGMWVGGVGAPRQSGGGGQPSNSWFVCALPER